MTPDPKEHAQQRNLVESVLRFIPGFHGYLEKEYRRESDSLARGWLVDHLQRGKQSLDDYGRSLLDSGQLEGLDKIDRAKNRLDKVISRLAGQMQGYSGFFDYVRVNEALLDEVYEHDLRLMKQVEQFVGQLAQANSQTSPAAEILAQVLPEIDSIDQHIDHREHLLKGLA